MRLAFLILALSAVSLGQDKAFKFWSAAVATSATVDIETTQAVLDQPGRYEINPLLGPHPSRARMYATVGAIDSGVMFATWKLRKKKYWWILPAVAVAVHVGGTVYTLKH